MQQIIHNNAIEQGRHKIEELKRKMKSKALARLFCCMHTGDKNYVYSMENLESIQRSYLEKVKQIIIEHHMKDEIYNTFKNDTKEILHDAAIIRKEHSWVDYFVREQ